jgi:hypothetical protein
MDPDVDPDEVNFLSAFPECDPVYRQVLLNVIHECLALYPKSM